MATLNYADARAAAEKRATDQLPEKETFTREEVLARMHKASLIGFNEGATWAQDNPEEAPTHSAVGKLAVK